MKVGLNFQKQKRLNNSFRTGFNAISQTAVLSEMLNGRGATVDGNQFVNT
jgi:hypothetical protein